MRDPSTHATVYEGGRGALGAGLMCHAPLAPLAPQAAHPRRAHRCSLSHQTHKGFDARILRWVVLAAQLLQLNPSALALRSAVLPKQSLRLARHRILEWAIAPAQSLRD